MITTRKMLMVAATTVALGGCYSAQCEKMGYGPEGSPENARCVYVLNQNLARGLQQMSNNYNTPANNRYVYTVNMY